MGTSSALSRHSGRVKKAAGERTPRLQRGLSVGDGAPPRPEGSASSARAAAAGSRGRRQRRLLRRHGSRGAVFMLVVCCPLVLLILLRHIISIAACLTVSGGPRRSS